jgi:hypothetical protein
LTTKNAYCRIYSLWSKVLLSTQFSSNLRCRRSCCGRWPTSCTGSRRRRSTCKGGASRGRGTDACSAASSCNSGRPASPGSASSRRTCCAGTSCQLCSTPTGLPLHRNQGLKKNGKRTWNKFVPHVTQIITKGKKVFDLSTD